MKKFNKLAKRAVATFLSLMIVVSALSGALTLVSSALVTESDYSISNVVADAQAIIANTDKKLSVAGTANVKFTKDSGATFTDHTNQKRSDVDKLNNSLVNSSFDLWLGDSTAYFDLNTGDDFDAKDYDKAITAFYSDKSRYIRIIQPLKATSNIENIVLALHSTPKLISSNFAVFASNDEATLFDKTQASFYKEVENTDSKQYFNFSFAEGKLNGVKYIGLEIYSPDNNNITDRKQFVSEQGIKAVYPRLCEFDAYGTAADFDADISVDDSNRTIPSDIGEVVLNTKGFTAQFINNGAVVQESSAEDAKHYDGLVDGDHTPMYMKSNGSTAFYDIDPENAKKLVKRADMHFDVVMPVKEGYSVQNLLLVHSGSEHNNTGEYEVYASADLATLFNASNKKITYKNTNNKSRQVIAFGKDVQENAKFIGVRVTDPIRTASTYLTANTGWNNTYAVPRLAECNIYGKKLPAANVVTDDDATVSPSDVGEQLSGTPAITFGTDATACTETNLANLTDKNADTAYSAEGALGLAEGSGETLTFKGIADGKYFDAYYAFSTKQTIKALNVVSINNAKYYIGSFKVYTANSLDELFTDANLKATVSMDGKRHALVTFTKDIKAKYVGIRTDDVCDKTGVTSADEVYLRLAEFTAWGTNTAKSLTKTTNDNSVPTATGKNSVVKSMNSFYTHTCTGANNISDTPAKITMLTDGCFAVPNPRPEGTTESNFEFQHYGFTFADAPATEGANPTIHANDGEVYADYVATLQTGSDIEEIVFSGRNDKWATSYELYIGDNRDTLFDSANKVATHNNVGAVSNATKTQIYSVAGYTANYVGMRVTAVTTSTNYEDYGYSVDTYYPRLFEFDVYGTPGEVSNAPETGESIPVPTSASLVRSANAYFYNGTERKAITANGLNLLYDKSLKATFATTAEQTPFTAGSYLDIVLTLKGNCKLSGIYVANALAQNLRTGKYSIYVGNSNDDTLFTKPFATYNNADSSRVQSFTLADDTAKYVAIRIFNPVVGADVTAEDTVARLAEFNVFGNVITGDNIADKNTRNDMPTETNLLANKTVDANIYNKKLNKNEPAIGDFVNMTDGNVNVQAMFSTQKNWWVEWENETTPKLVSNGDVYVDILWTLNGTAQIDKLYYCGALGNVATLTGEFYLYASNTLEDIDNCEVAHVDNTVLQQEAFTFEFDTPLKDIRYVKLRITNPIGVEDISLPGTMNVTQQNYEKTTHNIYPRINEVVATGSIVDDPVVFQKVKKSSGSSLPYGVDLTADGIEHISQYVSAKAKYGKVREGELETCVACATDVQKNTDGNLGTHYDVGSAKFAEYDAGLVIDYTDNTSDNYNYYDLYYNMGDEVALKYLVFATTNSELCAGKYDVFISNNFKTMFNEENKYTTVDNVSEFATKGKQNVNVICFEEGTKAQYVAIRLYNPVSCGLGNPEYPNSEVTATKNHIYPRISEFAVYGNYTDPTFDPSKDADKTPPTLTDDELYTLYTQNMYKDNYLEKPLLKPENYMLYINNKRTVPNGTLPQKVKDLVTNKCYKVNESGVGAYMHNDFYDCGTGSGTSFVFALKDYDVTQVDGFVFMGSSAENSPYATSEYSVYVAEDLDDLFLPENRIYHYDPVGDDYTWHRNQLITSDLFEREAKGCYIAFKIDNPNYTGDNNSDMVPRMSFLYAWGKECEVTPVETNLLENMPVTAQFVNGNKFTVIPESNLTAKGLKNMNDAIAYVGSDGLTHFKSNLDTSGTINTKGTDRNTVSLTFNLCGDIDILGFGINTVINNTTGFKTMKVYAASTVSEVNAENSLVWTWNAGSKTGNRVAPSYKKKVNARYVRFVFTGTKDKLQFNTLEVIGMDNQKMKTRNLMGSLTSDDVEYFATTKNSNGKTVRESFSKIHNTITDYWLDGSDVTWGNFGYGYVGETSYDVMLYLGDLRTVNYLNLFVPYYFKDYLAKNINIYFGETSDVLNSTTPNYKLTPSDFKHDGITAKFERDIRPVMARYVRIELKNFPKLYGYREMVDGVEKYKIASFIPDVKCTGTKVSGMQKDSESSVLYTLADKASGVSVNILKLDNNDVYDKVTSIKVKESTITNWQMRSVQAANMKVIGKKVYEIEFYDFYGNKVTNIDNRSIQIGINTPSEFKDAGMIADASVRTTLTGLDSNQTGKITWSQSVAFKASDNKYCLLGITTATDQYWDTIGELENFAEGDLGKLNIVNGVIRTEEWFDSLHTFTESGADKVTMKPVNGTFEPGVKLVTTDISSTATDDEYYNILSYADGKKVAAFYNLALTYQGDDYALNGETVDVNLLLSDYVKNNYTDLQIFQTLADGTVVELWSQNDGTNLEFQTNTMGNIAIIGTALDGSSSVGIGGANGEYGEGGDFTSPATGETATTAAATILVLLAAGFVVATSIRRGLKNR